MLLTFSWQSFYGIRRLQHGWARPDGAVPADVCSLLMFAHCSCLLLADVQLQEPCEAVWQSALGCLMHLTTRAGLWVAGKLTTMPPAAAAALLDACITFSWSHELHAQLVEMSVNLLYVSGPAAAWEAGGCGSGNFWQEEAEQLQAKGQPAVQQQATTGGGRLAALHCQPDSVRQPSNGNCPGSRANAWEDDLPPHRLHGGPVDRQQLAALGGPQKLLQHFCHAASTGAQRTLMVPLLQVKHVADAPNANAQTMLADKVVEAVARESSWPSLPLPVGADASLMCAMPAGIDAS